MTQNIVTLVEPISVGGDMKSIFIFDGNVKIDSTIVGMIYISSSEKSLYVPITNLLGMIQK